MTDAEIDDLAARFTAATIRRADWTHQAHLVVGAWHVHRFGADGALARLRAGIHRLNEANGVANTATEGYHETITAAYVRLLARALADLGDLGNWGSHAPLADRVGALLAGPVGDKAALSRHYSREVLMSPRARAEWVPPDRAPLPEPYVFSRSRTRSSDKGNLLSEEA